MSPSKLPTARSSDSYHTIPWKCTIQTSYGSLQRFISYHTMKVYHPNFLRPAPAIHIIPYHESVPSKLPTARSSDSYQTIPWKCTIQTSYGSLQRFLSYHTMKVYHPNFLRLSPAIHIIPYHESVPSKLPTALSSDSYHTIPWKCKLKKISAATILL
jgi:hypothetical protein